MFRLRPSTSYTRLSGCIALCAALAACVNSGDASRADSASAASVVAITHVGVLDVEGGRIIDDQTVVVRDDRIEAVGPSTRVTPPPNAQLVDGRGRYLTPGFADMHVHLYTDGDLFTYVANGITTVRNMAGDSTHLSMRRRIAAGTLIGPRIIAAGPVVEASPLSHRDNVALDAPGDVRKELVRQQAAGYDFVKVYNRLSRPVYDSVIAIARELKLPVAGHVPTEVGLDRALAGRQGSIEHYRGYIHALLAPDSRPASDTSFRDWSVAWNRIDDARIAPLVARTVAAGVWNVPTFAFTVHELSPNAVHAGLLARPEVKRLSLEGLPSNRATTSYLRQFTEADFVAAQRGLDAQFRLTRALDSAGAGLLVGTDSWLAGYAFADEVELLVRAGLTPARVLRMATLDAARFLGESDQWGVIAKGQRADLVLLDANPLVNIGNVRRVQAVVLRGRLLAHDDIAARLAALPGKRAGAN